MVPYCSFLVHTAGNTYQREIPRLYSGETIFAMCPLHPEGGGFWPVGLLRNHLPGLDWRDRAPAAHRGGRVRDAGLRGALQHGRCTLPVVLTQSSIIDLTQHMRFKASQPTQLSR